MQYRPSLLCCQRLNTLEVLGDRIHRIRELCQNFITQLGRSQLSNIPRALAIDKTTKSWTDRKVV